MIDMLTERLAQRSSERESIEAQLKSAESQINSLRVHCEKLVRRLYELNGSVFELTGLLQKAKEVVKDELLTSNVTE
jgi:chromosome segregation ATPase